MDKVQFTWQLCTGQESGDPSKILGSQRDLVSFKPSPASPSGGTAAGPLEGAQSEALRPWARTKSHQCNNIWACYSWVRIVLICLILKYIGNCPFTFSGLKHSGQSGGEMR